MKKYIIILSMACTFASSCKDFLEEEMVASITQDYFDTEQGLEQLIVNTYSALRFKYGWVEGAVNFEIGSDITSSGNWNSSSFHNDAWRAAGSGDHHMGKQVDNLLGYYSGSQTLGAYPGINNCNRAIESIAEGKALGQFADDTKYASMRMAEAKFNRAWWYYMLVTQLGDVYMTLKSNNTVPENYNFQKASSKDLYAQMIEDVRYGWDNLPETTNQKGRHTKYVAAHFLAKLYLQRAQAAQFENSSAEHLKMLFKGNVSTDADSAIYFATQVIESGYYRLEPNYWSLFDVKMNDYSNENSAEIIMAAGFGANNGDNGRYGMRSQGYFTATYVNTAYGLFRSWTYGSNNTGFKPTDFAYDVFTNKLADSRFEKSFRVEYETVYTAGDAKGTPELPFFAYDDPENQTVVWKQSAVDYFNNHVKDLYNRPSWGGRTAVVNQHRSGTGDIGLCFIENTKATAITLKKAEGQPYSGLWPRWVYDEDNDAYYYRRSPLSVSNTSGGGFGTPASGTNTGLEFGGNTLPGSKKHIDPNRSGMNQEYGT
ncbi:MAG: RagB/SusD family nutrient uptake outer membrane protein, partial [Tannerella sp.]|nr:RagB/SusD family nutrient uptake outer membrane protein [Tannerella sp.]